MEDRTENRRTYDYESDRRRSAPSSSRSSTSRGRSRSAKGTSRRGFASMDSEQQRRIASMGGRAAHESGHAHQWNSKEARRAGHLGGVAAHRYGTAHEWDSREASRAGRRGGLARGRNNSRTRSSRSSY